MSVIAPLFLLGALFAALPVIIHLFYQKRAPQVYFSTIRFLQACVRKTARRKRIENLLLLAFRMLLFGLLAVALAKPFVRSSLAGSSGPTSTCVVLDNSYSMATRQEGRERFAPAKDAAIQAVQRMGPSDSVALLFTGGERAGDKVELSHRFNEVLPAIEQAQVFAGYGSVLAAVNRAYEVMAASTDANREIIVITDLQAKSLEGELSKAALESRDVPLFVYDCGQEAVVNLGVVDATLKGGRMPGSLQTVVAEIANAGDADVREARVTLYVDGKDVKKELVNVPAKGKAAVPFTFPAAADRTVTGWVQLSPDSLDVDNRWNFRIGAADRINVLVVRDEAAAIGYLDDDYYLVRALAPSSGDNEATSPIRPQRRLTSELSRAALDQFSAIFLLNVREIDSGTAAKLRRWVEEGGMLVFFAGDRVDPSRYSNVFRTEPGGLFPAKLGAPVGDAEKRDTSRHMQSPDFNWPGFARLRPVSPSLFERVRAWRWLPLENPDPAKVQVLATLAAEGQPPVAMISAARVERGEVFYVSIPATTGWSNFPATKVFVPMLHEMIYAVTGKSGRLESTLAGQPKRFDFADVNGEVLVSVETGRGVEVRKSTHDASGNFVQFEDTWSPGIYAYTLSGAKQAKDFFVVNPDPRESDLSRMSENVFREKFAALRLVLVRSNEQLAAERIALREGHPLSGYVFLLILFIAAFELYLANRTRPATAEAPGGEAK